MPSPIAIIIPALNEEAALAPMLDGLRAPLDAAACVDADIVVVDNGSRDATAAVARERGAREVSEPRRGWGQACLAGMAALSPNAEIVVFLDADESDDPEDLGRLLAPVREGKADLVLGSRTASRCRSKRTGGNCGWSSYPLITGNELPAPQRFQEAFWELCAPGERSCGPSRSTASPPTSDLCTSFSLRRLPVASQPDERKSNTQLTSW